MRTVPLIFALLGLCSVLQAGPSTHIRKTTVTDGFFYADSSPAGVFHFESQYGTEDFDISGRAFLTASGVYPPEIPGLQQLKVRTKDGKAEIDEPDPEAIRTLTTKHGPGTWIFRTADMGLFYVLRTGKTPARKISIETENGDFVILWRNRE